MFRSRRILLMALLAIVSSMCYGEEERIEEKGKWTENILKIKYGFNNTLDPYLSPLQYSGQEIGIGNEWWGNFKVKKLKGGNALRAEEKNGGNALRAEEQGWLSVGRLDLCGQRAYSAAKSNLFYAFGIQGSWAGIWQYQLSNPTLQSAKIHGIDFLVGPELAIDFRARQHASNINKPYSFDLGIDVNAATGVALRFGGEKTAYRLRYMIRTNLIGTDWTPEYWQSMYEASTGQWKQNVRCSGPWNRNVVRQELSMDFQFIRSTWRLGAEHEWMTTRTRTMDWIRHEVRLVVGCAWKYHVDGRSVKM